MTMRRLFVLTSKASTAMMLAALSFSTAYAFDIGHARVISTAAEPLRISVQLRDVADFSTLKATLAPAEQWGTYGLIPPTALTNMAVQVDAQRSRIVVEAKQASDLKVVDLLIDVANPSGVQRHQVSVLNASALAPIQLPEASGIPNTTDPTTRAAKFQVSSNATESPTSITVQRGDTLSRIAREWAPIEVSHYQYMAAIHSLNPHAFTHDNINFIHSGTRLKQPSLEQIKQFSDAQARRFFVQQAQWFEQYKSLLAKGLAPTLAAQEATHGLATTSAQVSDVVTAQGDRLELSQTNDTNTVTDKAVATAQALQSTTEQVSQLEENLHHLNQALQERGGAAAEYLLDGVKDLGVDLGPLSGSAVNHATDTDASTNTKAAGEMKSSETALKAKAGKTVSWIQEHMLMVMSSLLMLIVVLTIWILRRANVNRDYTDSPAPVSSDMVREKLEKINLDLDVPPSDEQVKP